MHSLERRNKIIDLLNNTGTVMVNALSEQFSVSEVTIRSDLRLLEEKGLLIRFHGGATLNNHPEEKPFNELQLEERFQRFADPKKRIALEAIKRVKSGDTIILDSGSTTMMIAEELVKLENLTVITNNLPAASVLSNNSTIMLFVCGGTLRHKTCSLHGQIAEQSLVGVAADILFVGADGIDAERGITTFNEGYSISEVMANAAKTVVAVLDSSKFGKSGFNLVLPLKKLDEIITDKDIDEKYRAEFKTKNVLFTIV